MKQLINKLFFTHLDLSNCVQNLFHKRSAPHFIVRIKPKIISKNKDMPEKRQLIYWKCKNSRDYSIYDLVLLDKGQNWWKRTLDWLTVKLYFINEHSICIFCQPDFFEFQIINASISYELYFMKSYLCGICNLSRNENPIPIYLSHITQIVIRIG